MVNASLNWASIVGIVLAVCGAGLYFMRTFKPALARDYDVFFAAIGLLCGGILFFQGWRLDPILQFGQFLLAGTTVFFAYESVRLRGIAADQARRSSYFDDEPSPPRMAKGDWDEQYEPSERFSERQPIRRRFTGEDNQFSRNEDEDFYSPRRKSRAAIPEEAASRVGSNRSKKDSWDQRDNRSRRQSRFRQPDNELNINRTSSFGERRNLREEQRRGSRPTANRDRAIQSEIDGSPTNEYSSSAKTNSPKGAPINQGAEDAAFSPTKTRQKNTTYSKSTKQPSAERRSSTRSRETRNGNQRFTRPRDNNARFDN